MRQLPWRERSGGRLLAVGLLGIGLSALLRGVAEQAVRRPYTYLVPSTP